MFLRVLVHVLHVCVCSVFLYACPLYACMCVYGGWMCVDDGKEQKRIPKFLSAAYSCKS